MIAYYYLIFQDEVALIQVNFLSIFFIELNLNSIILKGKKC